MTRRSMSTHAKLYRVLLRQCRAYDDDSLIWLQPPIDPHTAGSARLWTTRRNTNSIHAVYQWFALQPEWKAWYQEMAIKLQGANEDDSSSDSSSSDDSSDDEEELDRSLWTTSSTLQQALRTAFRQSPPQYAPLALQAFRQLRHQWHQQEYCTSTNTEHNIRISVLSQYIGRSLEHKYRFAYRVRIERLIAEEEEEEEATVLSADDMAVQLLGRTWHIVESSSNNNQDDDERTIVDAPTTGAVGQLPVLQRGSCFEYTSGAELSGRQGSMSGWFHFAPVPDTTSSAVVGMAVPALSSERKFRVEIKSFPLRVHEDDDDALR